MNDAILIDDRVSVRSERAAECHIQIELAALVEIDNTQPIGTTNLSAGGYPFCTQQAQQTGFAATVWPHQSDPHAGGDDEV